MKKIFTIIALILISQQGQSQITLEHSYANSARKMFGVNLSNSGFKYCMVDMINMTDNQVVLYNLDHSIFKTMPFGSTGGTRTIWYISENTFDLDSGVEFMVATNSDTRIYNEDGALLFERIGETPAWYNERSPQDQINSIFSTPNGTKMILSSWNDGASKIYSLPGSLPLAMNENLIPDYDIRLFPNPTKNNRISIAYTLPENIKIGKVNIYNSIGQIVKTFNVDNNFSTIELNTENLASGTYICEVLGNSKRISTSQFIVEN